MRTPDMAVLLPPSSTAPCPDPDPRANDTRRPEDCPDPRQSTATDQRGLGQQAPITPGRQFSDEPLWDTWFSIGPYSDTADQRFGLDNRTQSEFASVGIDRRLGANAVAGVSANFERNDTNGFDGSYSVGTKGFTVGPHVGYRFSDNWTMDGSVAAGWFDNDTRIDLAVGQYESRRYTAGVNLSGQYVPAGIAMRPRLSVSYTYSPTDAYILDGSINGGAVSVTMDAAKPEFGDTTAAMEFSKGFGRGGSAFIPYLEIAARYEYLRANGGQIMTGDLTLASTSPWSGSSHAGVRTLLGNTTFLELGVGYSSIGQPGLARWETKIFLSQGF